ncbi:zinc-binding dehydrogenase [Microbacterium marinilacus]|uniref:L-idonate 5-dehydrogenase n=1 Tax=Microbacterium marinilacus TaxID=415209 RepID=A0ABP7B7R9_9MICO|nr:zinc-binding dehydrogenase [Microbacterium marinilacus]MBY0687338.1 zinc-binding dehydrogenase [Microbacterium marinilacus]
MRAVYIDGRERMAIRETTTSEPGEGEVRLRVDFVGVCGSDLHYYFEGANGEYVVREPLVPGHELSGRVDLDPSGRLAPGTPVTVHPARFGTPERGIEDDPHLWPGGSYLGSASTWPHTQGGMSELLVVDAGMVRVLPDGLPVRRAVLAEPLGVALHAATRAGDLAGANVLVSGAGPIGLLALAAAQARGAAHVTVADVLAEPLERASALGADEVIRVGADEQPVSRFDVVLECSGVAAAIGSAGVAVRRRGTVVQVGMVPDEPRPVNLAPFISKEVDLRGTFRFHDEIDEAVALLLRRPEIEQVVTHVLSVDDATEAFELARDSRRSGKVVVELGDDAAAER